MTNKNIDFVGLKIEDIEVGMCATYSHTVTDADVKAYAGISGDRNPVHMSDEYAKNSRFESKQHWPIKQAGYC